MVGATEENYEDLSHHNCSHTPTQSSWTKGRDIHDT